MAGCAAGVEAVELAAVGGELVERERSSAAGAVLGAVWVGATAFAGDVLRAAGCPPCALLAAADAGAVIALLGGAAPPFRPASLVLRRRFGWVWSWWAPRAVVWWASRAVVEAARPGAAVAGEEVRLRVCTGLSSLV